MSANHTVTSRRERVIGARCDADIKAARPRFPNFAKNCVDAHRRWRRGFQGDSSCPGRPRRTTVPRASRKRPSIRRLPRFGAGQGGALALQRRRGDPRSQTGVLPVLDAANTPNVHMPARMTGRLFLAWSAGCWVRNGARRDWGRLRNRRFQRTNHRTIKKPRNDPADTAGGEAAIPFDGANRHHEDVGWRSPSIPTRRKQTETASASLEQRGRCDCENLPCPCLDLEKFLGAVSER